MKADSPINSVAEVATISQENIAGCLVPQVVPEGLSETMMSWNRFLSGSVCFLDSPIFCFSLIKTHSKFRALTPLYFTPSQKHLQD